MIKKLWLKFKEYILYLLFGGLTTLVNYIVFFLVDFIFVINAKVTVFGSETDLGVLIANAIAWVAAVAFAYITNRKWVFESKARGFGPVMKEIGEFTLARIVTLVTEEILLLIFVNICGFNEFVIKIIASIVTIVLNYIFSKFIIFKQKKEPAKEVNAQSKESETENAE